MHSILQNFLKFVWSIWGRYIDKYINIYTRVKPENIIKLKHYMYNALSFDKTRTVRPRFLPYHAYPT